MQNSIYIFSIVMFRQRILQFPWLCSLHHASEFSEHMHISFSISQRMQALATEVSACLGNKDEQKPDVTMFTRPIVSVDSAVHNPLPPHAHIFFHTHRTLSVLPAFRRLH